MSKSKQEVVGMLQAYVTAVTANAINHQFQAQVFGNQGFRKLKKKYDRHATEELDFVTKAIDRMLDLGGDVKQEAAPEQPVITDFLTYLKADADKQTAGMQVLEQQVNHDNFDVTTYDLLKDYYIDEDEDLNWDLQTLDLIDQIGIQNYLTKQL